LATDSDAFVRLGVTVGDEELAHELELEEWPEDATIDRPADWDRRARLIALARVADRRGRGLHREARNRRHNGPLGHVAIEILYHLATSVDASNVSELSKGRFIAAAIGRSQSAVSTALKALRAHSLLDWLPDPR
jgi:hypothetical protein